ncbi:hypothetical protein [Clostridium botulinum]|uniref:hypothetical protein n=1 Tax=Clostridium botulinum TaxID=1491 RepID=UPI0004D4C01E|nr:hypothetical protein [Clostridium botulinum]KEH90592.1 hypothetical protein Z963_11780 [Clostridium botulinum C/D str. It1]
MRKYIENFLICSYIKKINKVNLQLNNLVLNKISKDNELDLKDIKEIVIATTKINDEFNVIRTKLREAMNKQIDKFKINN